MADILRPVDDAPICDPDSLRRIDPVWMRGRVKPRFWRDRANRRDYLLWLADRLGFRGMSDFYRLTLSRVTTREHGYAPRRHWGASALKAVQDCFPEYDWKPWLFEMSPFGFWDLPANRRSYFDWLGRELGFRQPEAWYQIRMEDVLARHGSSLLRRFPSFYDLMREYLPNLDWDRVDVHRPLTEEQIIAWADAYRATQGKWPTQYSGTIPESGDSWRAVNAALRAGVRGLAGGTTLPRLLEKHRGVELGRAPPRLCEEQILAWADAYFAVCGKWPTRNSGAIAGTGETWAAVQCALAGGHRGLGRKSSLAQLLAERRGARNLSRLPPLTEEQILAWADAYFARQGKWPRKNSGPIAGTEETWCAVDADLYVGRRGLPGLSSLALLLAERRGTRHKGLRPRLTEEQILAWADAYFAEHGDWPNEDSGAIAGADDTWRAVAAALPNGWRGLPRRLTLPQLLDDRRGVPNRLGLPPLSEKQILRWADAYFREQGKWPTITSGPIAGTSETWDRVNAALNVAGRGLPRRFSLAQLLDEQRGKRNRMRLPRLKESKILAWAWRYFRTNGRWPNSLSGPIAHSPGDTWKSVDGALAKGCRGLPGGSSLLKLLRKHGLK